MINDEIEILKKKCEAQDEEINYLKKEIKRKDDFINSIPQISATSIGVPTSNNKIIYRNWWSNRLKDSTENEFCDEQWFTKFLEYHFPDADYKINMFSVFNNQYTIKRPMDGKKVFFSGENLNYRFEHVTKDYGLYALDYVDFAMGFDIIDHPKYLRFPLWIMYLFRNPQITEEDIEKYIEQINSYHYEKSQDAVVIASHDKWNTRSCIADSINYFVDINFAGSWRNNTDDLQKKYDDNKMEYLKEFKFNICAENLDDDAYVTEKIFQAIQCDCIPLYLGGGNYLEPKVINENAIIRWYLNEDNADATELFINLISDEKSYNEFKEQNVLKDTAAKTIINKFSDLKKRFENLIYE